MSIFDRNKNLEKGTVVYFLPNNRLGEEIAHGRIHAPYEYEHERHVQYYVVEVWVPEVGDTYLTMRTNMNVYTDKSHVPTRESIFGALAERELGEKK